MSYYSRAALFNISIFLIVLALEAISKRIFKNKWHQGLPRKEWVTDLSYFIMNSSIMFAISMLFVQFLSRQTYDLELVVFLRGTFGQLPIIFQFLTVLFIYDLSFYWIHRMLHQLQFKWNYHYVHHRISDLDYIATYRFHVLDYTHGHLLYYTLGVLSGMSEPAMTLYLVAQIILTPSHAKFFFRIRFLENWIISPFFHHWHHDKERGGFCNLALYFPFIDRIFGTLYLPDHWPREYGLSIKRDRVQSPQNSPEFI